MREKIMMIEVHKCCKKHSVVHKTKNEIFVFLKTGFFSLQTGQQEIAQRTQKAV